MGCGGLWWVAWVVAADAQRCWGAGKLRCNGQPEPTGTAAEGEAGSPALAPVPFCGVLPHPSVASRDPEKAARGAGNAVMRWGCSLPEHRLTAPQASARAAPRVAGRAGSDEGSGQGDEGSGRVTRAAAG